MTLTVEPADPPLPDLPRPEDPDRPHRSRAAVLMLVGIVVAALAAGVWWIVGQSALAGVSVTYDMQPIVCEGADVGQRPYQDDGGDFILPVVVLTDGMQCRLRFHVVNDGWADIEITDVTLAMMGKGNGMALEPQFVNPNGQTAIYNEDTFDVTFALEGPVGVGPGDSQLLEAVIEYHGGARMSQCTGSLWNIPSVGVAANGVSTTRSPPESSLIWFQQGSMSECAVD